MVRALRMPPWSGSNVADCVAAETHIQAVKTDTDFVHHLESEKLWVSLNRGRLAQGSYCYEQSRPRRYQLMLKLLSRLKR